MKKLLILSLIFLTLLVCSDTASQSDQNDLRKKMIALETQNMQLTNEINSLQDKLKTYDRIADQHKHIKQQLEKEIQALQTRINTPSFNVNEEKLLVDPKMLNPHTLNIDQIKEWLWEPNYIEEVIAAHGSGKDITLIYDEATFTFHKDDG